MQNNTFFIFVSLLISLAYPSTSFSNNEDPSNILLSKVYNSHYEIKEVANSASEKNTQAHASIAKKLFSHTLQDIVDQNIIKREGMIGLTLPLGLYENTKHKVDFHQGMKDMWNHKINNYGPNEAFTKKKTHFLSIIKKGTSKSSLPAFRDQEISQSYNLVKELHSSFGRTLFIKQRHFMNTITRNLVPDVMMGFLIQELLPPKYKSQQINSVFKAYFFNRLLCEGGIEFIEGFPAGHDSLLSYGPFQLTDVALQDYHGNNFQKYIERDLKIPSSMGELNGIQKHADVAALFAYSNWLRVANVLARNNLLRKFNTLFNRLDQQKQRIFIAGITASMHHSPARTRRKVIEYVKKHNNFENIHYQIKTIAFVEKGRKLEQLQKYYDNAVKAFLIMKHYHTLDDEYSTSCKS